MAEKVLYEFRAERGEDGYRYKIRRGDSDFKVVNPTKRRFFSRIYPFCGPWDKGSKRYRHLREKSRRRMRETLDLFEKLYDDLYGEEGIKDNQG